MDLFLMKLLLIKSPGTPRPCWGRRPGAGGGLAALRGEGNTLDLGLVVPPSKRCWDLVLGTQVWESLGVPNIPKLLLLFVLLLADSCHPSTTTLSHWFPLQGHMLILQDWLPLHSKCICIFDLRVVAESVGSGVSALPLTAVYATSLSLSFLIFIMGIIPVPASCGC